MNDPAGTRGTRFVATILALVLVSGCSGSAPVVSLSPPRRSFNEEDYSKYLERWTRHARIIRQLDTTLRVHATLRAPEFNAAFLARRAHMFNLPGGEIRRLSRESDDAWSKGFRITMAAASMDYSWNDFERKETVWRVTLENDRKEQVSPEAIKAVKIITVTTKAFFPYVDRFYRVYELRFPRTLSDGRPLVRSDTTRLVMNLSGPLGSAELVWRIK